MNKIIRILVVVAFMLAVVVLGMKNTVWADRLAGSNPSAAAVGSNQASPLGSRPQGTVETGDQNVPVVPGQTVTVGSCASILIKSAPAGVAYTASVVDETQLSKEFPGNLVSCGVQIKASPGTNLGAEAQVCFPIPPDKAGFAYYWDGTKWVKTTLEVKDNQSCVMVPSTAGNPAFAALFDK